MTDLLPPWPLFSAFLLASFVLAVTPGPGVLYIVTRSLVQGRRSGLVSVAGVALGDLGNAFAASVGLAALFAVSSLAFSVVRYAGALYLVFLGVQMLRTSPGANSATIPFVVSITRVFRDGFVVALLNPKTTLFFAAFLPQFLTLSAPPMFQSMALCSPLATRRATRAGVGLAVRWVLKLMPSYLTTVPRKMVSFGFGPE
ncbi:MAG: LysE family translocator [Burkholderiales bacterium]